MGAKELRQALSSAELAELQKRNEQRAQELRERMGTRYLLHPANRVQPQPRQGVLG